MKRLRADTRRRAGKKKFFRHLATDREEPARMNAAQEETRVRRVGKNEAKGVHDEERRVVVSCV